MKRVAFLSLSFLTFYFSAMYRSSSLMLLFSMEILIIVCMWLISQYMKRHLKVHFPIKSAVKEKNTEMWCNCEMINTGKLPVSRLKLRLWIHYFQEDQGRRGYLYASSECGKHNQNFGVCAQYCGLLCVELEELIVYDYMAFFSSSEDLNEVLKIGIIPSAQPLMIELISYPWEVDLLKQDGTISKSGDAVSEIRQLREQRAGDSLRHIHWNESAKTDKIWIKEYERDAYSCFTILLDIKAEHWKNIKNRDAFYRVCYAILLGLLEKVDAVRVIWSNENQNDITEVEVWDQIQCQNMMMQLYQEDFSTANGNILKTIWNTKAYPLDEYLKLDSELSWYINETLIYHFSVENLEEEMTKKVFAL